MSNPTMTHWLDIGPVADFPDHDHVCTHAGGKEVVVFRRDDQFYAIRNVCPHAGLPLGEGECRGVVLTCPFHGYAYNVKTGRNIDWPREEPPVRTYPVRVRNEMVQIEMEPAHE